MIPTTNQANEKNDRHGGGSGLDTQMAQAHCRTLRLPTVGSLFTQLAEDAVRSDQTPTSFLAALLEAEVEERERRERSRGG